MTAGAGSRLTSDKPLIVAISICKDVKHIETIKIIFNMSTKTIYYLFI